MQIEVLHDLTQELVDAGLVDENRFSFCKEIMTEYFTDKIAIIWTHDDVYARARKMEREISEEQVHGGRG